MQFIGRFDMQPDNELNNICKTMDIQNISIERIDQEFRKLFLKSKKPSLGINWLNQVNRLEQVLPELYQTIDVPQEPDWHPEGDVYEHSLQALDASANLDYEDDNQKLIIMWSALLHDLGKATKTEKKDGRIISYGHEIDSEKLARKLLKRITRDFDLIDSVCILVRYHMQPGQLVIHNSTPAAYKRLASKLNPYANLQMLAKLMLADSLARNPKKGEPLSGKVELVEKFLEKIEELNIAKSPEEPILQGRDLLDVIPPGPDLGKILKAAYEIQIDENIKDKKTLRNRALEIYNKK
jgi:tRNA nucleotidyltransferase (CCA-adding enzyme)